jgi:hypothetical protein
METMKMNSALNRLRIGIAAMGLVVASEAHAQCADCVTVTVNSNVNVTNLHPKVTALQVQCDGTGVAVLGRSNKMQVVNRAFVGLATTTLSVSAAFIASRPGHSINVSCRLALSSLGGDQMAVARSGPPQNITDVNWNGVATGSWNSVTPGSTIQWDQLVTFPNAGAP